MSAKFNNRRFAFAGRDGEFVVVFRDGSISGLIADDLDVSFRGKPFAPADAAIDVGSEQHPVRFLDLVPACPFAREGFPLRVYFGSSNYPVPLLQSKLYPTNKPTPFVDVVSFEYPGGRFVSQYMFEDVVFDADTIKKNFERRIPSDKRIVSVEIGNRRVVAVNVVYRKTGSSAYLPFQTDLGSIQLPVAMLFVFEGKNVVRGSTPDDMKSLMTAGNYEGGSVETEKFLYADAPLYTQRCYTSAPGNPYVNITGFMFAKKYVKMSHVEDQGSSMFVKVDADELKTLQTVSRQPDSSIALARDNVANGFSQQDDGMQEFVLSSEGRRTLRVNVVFQLAPLFSTRQHDMLGFAELRIRIGNQAPKFNGNPVPFLYAIAKKLGESGLKRYFVPEFGAMLSSGQLSETENRARSMLAKFVSNYSEYFGKPLENGFPVLEVKGVTVADIQKRIGALVDPAKKTYTAKLEDYFHADLLDEAMQVYANEFQSNKESSCLVRDMLQPTCFSAYPCEAQGFKTKSVFQNAQCNGNVNLQICQNNVDAYTKGNISFQDMVFQCNQSAKNGPGARDDPAQLSDNNIILIFILVFAALTFGTVLYFALKKPQAKKNEGRLPKVSSQSEDQVEG